MRRKDREMPRAFGENIIDKAHYGILSLCDNDTPYSIPLSLVRDENYLYFHCATKGTKLDIIDKNPKVSVCFVGHVEVPENYTNQELDQMLEEDPFSVRTLTSKVFTTEFESAIVKGTCVEATDPDQKKHILRKICEKYTPDKMKYVDLALENSLHVTKCYQITIEELTAKRKKFGPDGVEIKK